LIFELFSRTSDEGRAAECDAMRCTARLQRALSGKSFFLRARIGSSVLLLAYCE
jgi:hypothetical protein